MKKILIGIVIAVTIGVMAVGSYSISGFFTKAYDKTLSPGEIYEKNITIRNFYNLTIRFQKEGSSSYLTFDNNLTSVVLKDAGGNEVARFTGVANGRIYTMLEKTQLNSISKAFAENLDEYENVVGQSANITYSGTTAYLTIKVVYKPGMILGYVTDELTGNPVEGVYILALANGADPNLESPINQSITDSNGKYLMSFLLTSSKSLDIYVKDFDTS